MLYKIIKSAISSNKFTLLNLFVEATENVHQTANILAELINNTNNTNTEKLTKTLKKQRKKAISIHTSIEDSLRNQLRTQVSRSDANQLSTSVLQLTKCTIKIYKKIQVYNIDIKTDDCLILSVLSLQNITKSLKDIMLALKNNDHKFIQSESKTADELDDNVLDELSYLMNEISINGFDETVIVGINDVYSELESAIDQAAVLCDLAKSISIKII